jgi:membrane-associated phospholipid phosphatase
VSERAKRSIAASLGCLLALALLAALSFGSDSLQRLDARALHRLSMQRDAPLGDVAGAIAHLGDPLPQVLLLAGACLVALHFYGSERALAVVALVAGANLTTQLLKLALAQPRLQPILGYYQVGETAFPSGHTTAAAAMTYAYVLAAPRRRRMLAATAGAVLTVAVGASLVVLRKHFPSDVLGGLLVASVWFFATLAVLRARAG